MASHQLPVVVCDICGQKGLNADPDRAERVCIADGCRGMMVPNGETREYNPADY